MQQLSTALIVALVAASLLLGETRAATHGLPPLPRESPNARSEDQTRADADLDYRLPNTTSPVHYDVELSTNVHKGEKAFTGSVKIELLVNEATDTIVIHARQLEKFVAKIKSLKDATAQELTLTPEYEKEREFLSLKRAGQTFAKDSKWLLTITYEGQLRTDNGGFYYSTYTDSTGKVHSLATTQFESTDARHAFPCYDEPAKRANFTITINHDASYRAISNMPVDSAKSTNGKTVFKTTVNMSTYLVAFIVSDFEWTEGVLNDLPQRVYSRKGTEHDQEWALVSGMLIVDRLANYYGVDFALPKLDQVAVPDFAAGAMENWGLVTYREEYMLYNKLYSTVNTQTAIANIIAHEYTHQWFGNLVALKWWTYLWLKEGFATLYSYQATDEAYPEWGIYQMFHTDEYQRALNSDAGNITRPMTHYVQKPREISSLYDSISYSKAGAVLHMWQHALTDKVFKQGLHNYLTINQYSSAEEWQLFDAIQTASAEENVPVAFPVRDMMGSWTQQGGYPLLTVERNYNDGTFTVKQEAFFNSEHKKENKYWYVPINYAVQSNPDFRDTTASLVLPKKSDPVAISTSSKLSNDDWLILNKQSTGYYRINYDERNWGLITEGLISRSYKIHPRNRAQLMHDAYRFSSSKRLPHSILLQLMSYLVSEDQYAPWSTANGILTTFNRYLSGDKDYKNFQFYAAHLVSNIYDKLGVDDIDGEQHFQKYTRSVAINLACMAGINSCLQETNNKLKARVENNIEIEPNLQSQIYCNGLKQSGDKEFDFVYELLMGSENQAQRRLLISSLGCAQKEQHVQKFIRSSIDNTNKLRVQERPTLLSAAYSRGEVGLLASIKFLDENWEAYQQLNGGFGGSNPLESDIRGISQYVVNEQQQKELKALVAKVKHSDKLTQSLESDVDNTINANFDWLKQNRDPLMKWIGNFRSGAGSIVTTSFLTFAAALTVLFSRWL